MAVININDFVIFTDKVMAAKNQSGSLGPDERNVAIWQAVQIHYNVLYGLPETYRQGNAVPMGWQITQDITDSMSPFLVSGYSLVVDRFGRAPLPADYVHKSSLQYPYYENACDDCEEDKSLVPQLRPVKVLRDNETPNRLTSGFLKPTLLYPVASFQNGRIQFYPTNVGLVLMDYLRIPARPVWGYTMTGTTAIYDPLTSTNIEFPPQEMPMIAMRYLSLFGINLREDELKQFAELNIRQGV